MGGTRPHTVDFACLEWGIPEFAWKDWEKRRTIPVNTIDDQAGLVLSAFPC
jgi:hypothetical protein